MDPPTTLFNQFKQGVYPNQERDHAVGVQQGSTLIAIHGIKITTIVAIVVTICS